MVQFKIGLVGASQLSFPGDKKTAFQYNAEGLKTLCDQLGDIVEQM